MNLFENMLLLYTSKAQRDKFWDKQMGLSRPTFAPSSFNNAHISMAPIALLG